MANTSSDFVTLMYDKDGSAVSVAHIQPPDDQGPEMWTIPIEGHPPWETVNVDTIPEQQSREKAGDDQKKKKPRKQLKKKDLSSPVTPRKKSAVWEYYSKVCQGVAKCLLCEKEVSHPGGNTSNLFFHLKARHREIYDVTLREKMNGQKLPDKTPPKKRVELPSRRSKGIGLTNGNVATNVGCYEATNIRAQTITKAVVIMMAKDYHPFSIANDAGFRKLVRTLDPKYDLPTAITFTRTIVPNLLEEVKDRVRTVLKQSDTIALTTDFWKSEETYYLSVNSNFLTEEFQPFNVCLHVKRVNSETVSENIVEILNESLVVWGVDWSKVNAVVTESEDNMVAAAQRVRWPWRACIISALQQAITDSINNVPSVLELPIYARTIATFFLNNEMAQKNLDECIENLQLPKVELTLDYSGNWISTYTLLRNLYELKLAITTALHTASTTTPPPQNLSQTQWQLLEGIVETLGPFEEAIKCLTSDSLASISMAIPIFNGLLSILQTSPDDVVLTFKQNLQTSIMARFPGYQDDDYFIKSMVLDPRFKSLLCKPPTVAKAKSILMEDMRLKASPRDANSNNFPSPTSGNGEKHSSQLWAVFDLLVADKSLRPSIDLDTVFKQEIEAYLAEPTLPRGSNPLEYWRQNRHRFPKMAALARQYLAIPATTSNETRGALIERRRCLDASDVEVQVFLHKNL